MRHRRITLDDNDASGLRTGLKVDGDKLVGFSGALAVQAATVQPSPTHDYPPGPPAI